ncbi:MAG: ABC transporter ATP-binding protein [Alphaproteobacteria bacterium]|nr:ABC transporter ATP-binding protein [Alphaproteobacteria bacterium]
MVAELDTVQDRPQAAPNLVGAGTPRSVAVSPLLRVDDLRTHFLSRDRYNRPRVAAALNGVSFSLDRGEILGLVGETGAGKSLTAYSILGLLKPSARIVGGQVLFDGQRLDTMAPAALNALRGRRLALVVQNPKTSLDPLTRVGPQLLRIYRHHRGGEAARKRVLAMLASVGIPDPERRYGAYPHELSGGMAQRVVIAAALINGPDLLIADEPTTGLDVTVQAQVLDLLAARVQAARMAVLLITHDLGIVAQYCSRVAVMYAGRIVEIGAVEQVLRDPAHPYTRALIAATPERLQQTGAAPPVNLPPPDLFALPSGCAYRDRCPLQIERCASTPPEIQAPAGQTAYCHRVMPAS